MLLTCGNANLWMYLDDQDHIPKPCVAGSNPAEGTAFAQVSDLTAPSIHAEP
jgi:hypothetical protein